MTLRDDRSDDEQVLAVARVGLVGAAIAALVLVVAAVRSWGSDRAVVYLVVAALLGVGVVVVGRRLLRD